MKKNLTAIILVFLLTAVAAWLFFKDKSFTLKKELSDFAVKDTASVTKIFLADQQRNNITLERISEGKWKINNKYEARKDAVNILLKTINMVEVKAPVPKAAFENVVKMIAGKHTKVEIYQGDDEPAKVYYVGNATADQYGTYMMMENSSVPFITHIPGFFGYLTTRYFTEEDEWRSRNIFSYNINDMKSVEVNYFKEPENSFIIDNIAEGSIQVNSPYTGKSYADIDTMTVYQYLTGYRDVNLEYYANKYTTPSFRDSIAKMHRNFTITVTDAFGKKNTVKAFFNPMPEGSVDAEGAPLEYDPDRMYALINNDKDFVVIQYFVFDNLTVPINIFLKGQEIVKK